MLDETETKVVGALDLRALIDIQELKIYQDWFVTTEYKEHTKRNFSN